MALDRCPTCQHAWFDGTTDFGGENGRAFVLKPVLGGSIQVRVGGEVICHVTREELQRFLDRTYGVHGST